MIEEINEEIDEELINLVAVPISLTMKQKKWVNEKAKKQTKNLKRRVSRSEIVRDLVSEAMLIEG